MGPGIAAAEEGGGVASEVGHRAVGMERRIGRLPHGSIRPIPVLAPPVEATRSE